MNQRQKKKLRKASNSIKLTDALKVLDNKAKKLGAKVRPKEILDESKKIDKKVQDAEKKGQVSEEHSAQLTFLNSVFKSVVNSLSNVKDSSPKELKKINDNLTGIKKLISDFAKDAIDKQDTSISYEDPKRQSSEATKKEEKSKGKKDKDKKGFLSWLLGLLGLGLGLLPFIGLLKKGFGFLKTIFSGGLKVAKGIALGVLWLGKNIKNLLKFTGKTISNIIDFVKSPVQWFKTHIWGSAVLWTKNLIYGILSKIPILKNTDFVKNGLKAAKAGKEALKAQRAASAANKVKTIKDTVKNAAKAGASKVTDLFKSGAKKASEAVKGAGSKIFEKLVKVAKSIPGLSWVLESSFVKKRLLPFCEKLADIAKKAASVLKVVIGKLWAIINAPIKYLGKAAAAKIGAKLARLATTLAGLGIPGPGWILTVIFTAWMLYDFVDYLFLEHGDHWNLKDLTNAGSYVLAAIVYAFIGIDIIGEHKEVWQSIEPLTEDEWKRKPETYSENDIKRASGEKLKTLQVDLNNEIKESNDEIQRLKNNTILYKDSNGNVLDASKSREIQNLMEERERLKAENAKVLADKAGKKNDPKWLDGEIEIKPENYQKMVDYYWDKNKGTDFFNKYLPNIFGSNDIDWQKSKIEDLKKSAERVSKDSRYNELYKLSKLAEIQAKIETHQKMIELLGKMDEDEAIAEIRKIDRYKDLTEIQNANTKRINEIADQIRKISGTDKLTEHSSTPNSNFSSLSNGQSLVTNQNGAIGSLGPTNTVSASGGTPKAVAAANYALDKANTTPRKTPSGKITYSLGECATYVKNALVNGGKYGPYITGDAWQMPGILQQYGYQPISTAHKPKIGDVAVVDKNEDHQYGHTAILTKKGWVSDFIQNGTANSAYGAGSIWSDSSPRRISLWRDMGSNGLNDFADVSVSDGGSSILTPANNYTASSNSRVTPTQPSITPQNNTTIIAQTPSKPMVEKASTLDLTEYWNLKV